MQVKTSCAYLTPCWSFFYAEFYNPTAWLLPAWLLPWMEKSCSNWVEDFATSWLDNQAETLVLYIAFGPNANLSRETMNEVAFGIEASGLAFLWDLSNDLVDLLPEVFEDRTTDRGFIWKSSSPLDIRVLAHLEIFFTCDIFFTY
ncbi:soyasaponin III rhamnosyltransferase-like [Lotus japonicus]|uniref:soyasaponin III rhamnosyltransferase-like n=1 Tax=Lotus japonicus TaxID=34305 RepID=UPI00258BA8FC|nr:soyasaponin III rhamnosyltransferase-like [Lotus japonicus]